MRNLKNKQTVKLTGAIAILALTFGVVYLRSEAGHGNHRTETAISVPPGPFITTTTLRELKDLASTNADIALMNLLCAGGLPEANDAAVQSGLVTLERWVARVKSETERHLYKFRADPGEFESSEAYFRMLMMAVVLYEDFGVRYNSKLISEPDRMKTTDTSPNPLPWRGGEGRATTGADYSFFANPRDVFIQGLLGDERTGTCSSMPVLYVAIGRRLGYPLKLVTTKAHLFIRWEGNGERFNLEATGKGMNRYDDEHYKQWPFPVTDEEIQADGFLKSLTSQEELALFLSIRGHCLIAANHYSEAEKSYAQSAQLAPELRGYRLLQQNALRTAQLAGKETP